ncbi:MAG: tetratricopeptide repeat protein [Lysobacteraceae bacterium]|nr:MAG: tetratricopeptide repeat protein [Xanthomonadaceae bacterium]
MNNMTRPGASNGLDQQRRAVRRNPNDAAAHALLGLALLKGRELEEGVACLQRALRLDRGIRDLQAVLAPALLELGRNAEAAEAYRAALRHQETPDLHQDLGIALLRAGCNDEAEASARRAVELAPGTPRFLLTLASTLHAQDKVEETVAVLEQALALDPGQPDVHLDLGEQLLRLKRHADAAGHYQAVLAVRPDNIKALGGHGVCHDNLKRHKEAIACFEAVLAQAPEDTHTLVNLSNALRNANDLGASLAALRRAEALAPDDQPMLRGLLHTCFSIGEWEEALRLARRVFETHPSPETHSAFLFILSHCTFDPDELTREHFAYGTRWETPLAALRPPHANLPDPQRPLRIGFVSADLRNHAVASFIMPIFEVLKDSAQLALFAYHNHASEDPVSDRLRACTAGWRSIVNLDDDAAERLIREDGIDILIDLSGHSAMNRLPLFARRPAPVQATWIGYAGTTGLRAMDYILCDQFLVPEGRYEDQFTEQIVRLPLGTPFMPEPGAPPVSPLPAQRNGYLTFGSFHRASKLSRHVIAQWAKLLHAIPDSRMLLGGMQAGIDDLVIGWFEQEGIARERLLLRPRAPLYDYLKQHDDVDICLCPFPYGGSTTIGHALWMGVPTLATVGATNPSHSPGPFLTHLGLNSFFTEDEETYVKLGVFLSQNLGALAAMRASMRDRFLKSLLGYPGVTAAAMELGLRQMWARWCAGKAAAPIRVRLSDLVPEQQQ